MYNKLCTLCLLFFILITNFLSITLIYISSCINDNFLARLVSSYNESMFLLEARISIFLFKIIFSTSLGILQ